MKPLTFHIHTGYDPNPVLTKLHEAVLALPDKDYDILVRDRHRSRTLSQNAKFHAIVNDMADETGYNPGELKEEIKDTLGLKLSIIGLDGKVREINKPTEDYSVDEMKALITRLIALCDTLGLSIDPQTDEKDDTP
jgi:AraC-like DNA-binding protein